MGLPSLRSPLVLTSLAMVAFAANSVFSRLGLEAGTMDAATFTAIRMMSGAVTLIGLVALRKQMSFADLWQVSQTNLKMAGCLFAYMALFTFAYISLATGVGALILFGSVQLTMFAIALRRGERFLPLAWMGIGLAIAGLGVLIVPAAVTSAQAGVNVLGGVMMLGAGVAWGFYSVLGRSAGAPLEATARNFLLGIPLVCLLCLGFADFSAISSTGVIWAVASGALASGCGYAIWYAVLPALKTGIAAVVQLTVPVIAAVGGILFLQEALTLQVAVSLILTLGGVFLTIRTTQN